MRVFPIGATGYIGSVVAEKLQVAGHTVVGLARSSTTAAQLKQQQIEPFEGDLQNPDGLALAAEQADAVIHTAFIHDFEDWAGAVQAGCRVIKVFAQALVGSGKPLIATSDTSVLGDTGSTIANESYPIAQGFLLAERAKAGCQAKGISFESATAKWGRGIATFFSINNQISANRAMHQLGWKPQASLSLLDDIAQMSAL